jgi:hypothetical protein
VTETFFPPRRGRSAAGWLLLLALPVILLTALLVGSDLYGALTLRYAVTGSEIIIHFGIQERHIPVESIVRVWTLEEPAGAVRLAGTSTPGLKSGRWRIKQTGPIQLYATSLDHLVVIETREGTYGITPEGGEAAIARALNERRDETFLPTGDRREALWGLLFPLLIVALVGGVLLFTFRLIDRFARELRYELGPDGLTIETGWRPIFIPYSQIREVDLASPRGSPWRVAGTQLPGVLWGRFSWKEAGRNLSLYATQAKPLVLIRLIDKTIGINPEEGERFVEALRQRI